MRSKRIKVLLIQPPVHELTICFGIMEPYALEVLSAAIKNDDALSKFVEVKILDLRVEPIKKFVKLLKSGDIDIVGITGLTIDQPKILEMAVLTKRFSPKTLFVVGGHHATMLPEDFFVHDIDLIVRGPGHKVILKIIKRKFLDAGDYSDIKGIIYNIGQAKFTECSGWIDNIDKAPPAPLNSRMDRKYRWLNGRGINIVLTAQGCSGRCSFCACWPAMAGKHIIKNTKDVFNEIAATKERWIYFGDDNTFQDVDRMKEMANLIKSSNLKKLFYGYSRTDTIVNHPELFEAWAKIGLKYLTVGFEDISDNGLEDYNKNSSTIINEDANNILQKLGIVNAAHILIKPNFTTSDFENIKNYTYELGIVEPVFPILTPLPGTALWKKHKKQVELMPRQFFDLAHPIIKTELSINEFYKLYIKLIRDSYSKKRWLVSKYKALANIFYGKNKYPIKQTISTNILSLLVIELMNKEISKEKINGFQKETSRLMI